MRKLSKTLLSLLLIAAMLASFVVLPAAAEEPAAEQPTEAVQAAETQATDSSFMKIFHLDCGRKYFTKDWILALINEISAAGRRVIPICSLPSATTACASCWTI